MLDTVIKADPWTLSGMSRLNADIEEPFSLFLRDTIADRARHTQFLNMLSMLEHIGSRKIMLSQMGGALNNEVLKHLAEETRHAVFFKTQAERLNDAPLGYDSDSMMCRQAATMYFGRLDAGITAALTEAGDLPYHWISLIVELRANWVYGLYHEELSRVERIFSLKSIIAEEKGHMADMYDTIVDQDAETPSRLPRFAALETKLFRRFWMQLKTN